MWWPLVNILGHHHQRCYLVTWVTINNYGHCLCLDNIIVDMKEGFGDNEDVSAGASDAIKNINLNTIQWTLCQKSGEKREKASSSEQKGKAKVSATIRIPDVVNAI